jgi:hypothetical protein
MRWLVAHELTTGLAERPCWGPMYGPGAVSEQSLTERLLERLEASVLMADIHFGVLSVAFAANAATRDPPLFRPPSPASPAAHRYRLRYGLL